MSAHYFRHDRSPVSGRATMAADHVGSYSPPFCLISITRQGRRDAWPLAVRTSSFPVPATCGRWPRLPGSASASSGLGSLAAPSAPLPASAGPQLSGLGAVGCPGVAGYTRLRRLAALTNSGSQVGSQGGQAPGGVRPRPATEAAGQRHAGPRPATPGDGRSVHGMQEVRSSSLRSSTHPEFSQVRALSMADPYVRPGFMGA
jgi:hypothetical protein